MVFTVDSYPEYFLAISNEANCVRRGPEDEAIVAILWSCKKSAHFWPNFRVSVCVWEGRGIQKARKRCRHSRNIYAKYFSSNLWFPCIPESPGNLILTTSGIALTLNWSPPTNVPPGVPVTYCLNVTNRARSNRYLYVLYLYINLHLHVQLIHR